MAVLTGRFVALRKALKEGWPELIGLSDREIDKLFEVSGGVTSKLRKRLTGAAPDPKKQAAGRKGLDARGYRPPAPVQVVQVVPPDDVLRRTAALLIVVNGPSPIPSLASQLGVGRAVAELLLAHPWFRVGGLMVSLTPAGRQAVA